jgi:hypothetical protein
MAHRSRRMDIVLSPARCLLLVFVGGLLLSAAWDADGNPVTDNLPQIVLPVAVTDGVEVDIDLSDDLETSAGASFRLRMRTWLHTLRRRVAATHGSAQVVLPVRGP